MVMQPQPAQDGQPERPLAEFQRGQPPPLPPQPPPEFHGRPPVPREPVPDSFSFDTPRDPQWYKHAVFYEVLIRGFHDSNGDGTGDIRGLTSRLDYLQWLGIDCIWLLPIYALAAARWRIRHR